MKEDTVYKYTLCISPKVLSFVHMFGPNKEFFLFIYFSLRMCIFQGLYGSLDLRISKSTPPRLQQNSNDIKLGKYGVYFGALINYMLISFRIHDDS